MNKKLISLYVLTVLLAFTFNMPLRTQKVEASGTIYIRANGSVEGTDKIVSSDMVTYTFTDNIYDEIVIERSNIIVDGIGYKLEGTETFGESKGIYLFSVSNVTIKNTYIRNFHWGVLLNGTSDNVLSQNKIVNNFVGVVFSQSSNNSVSGNNITENLVRSSFASSFNNTFANNTMDGVYIRDSFNNTLVGNAIGSFELTQSSKTTFYHNNVEFVYPGYESFDNKWDDGYPSGGNYWSDYIGTDSDNDGIGEEEYVIDTSNTDHYPLMGMFSSFNTSYGYAVNFVSNSSISDVSFNLSPIEVYPPEAILAFNVSGDTDTEGFLRVCIPKVLINGSYIIRFDHEIITNTTWPRVRELPCSNGTHSYFYINYTHSEHIIVITGITMIPEFLSLHILLLTMLATLVAIIIYKRKPTVISNRG